MTKETETIVSKVEAQKATLFQSVSGVTMVKIK